MGSYSLSEQTRGQYEGILPNYLYRSGSFATSGTRFQRSAFTVRSNSQPVVSSPFSALNPFGSKNAGDSIASASTTLGSEHLTTANGRSGRGIGNSSSLNGSKFMIPSASESKKIELYSTKYFYACAMGGVLSCGLTHCAMTPLDVVKCNMQIDPKKYKGILSGFRTVVAEDGVAGLLRGWVPTLVGYSVQGAGKLGFYEYFKYQYAQAVGPEAAQKHKTLLFLSASASAEFLADIGLSPFEAAKVRVQTQPGFAKGMADGLPKLIASDGFSGLYKGIVPLWGRQIPYTMMKFATFENLVQVIYKNVLPVPKEEVSKPGQLGVSFVAGYIAGIACAVISHPADNLVSYLNNRKGATVSMAFKDIGTLALFTRGLPLRILMIGTLTGAQWGIYDSFKVFIGLPTTGGH